MKVKLTRLTALALALLLCAACGVVDKLKGDALAEPPDLLWLLPYGELATAVLYSSATGGSGWEEAYTHLSQSIAANLKVTALDVEEELPKLKDFNVLYPDPSILEASGWASVKEALTAYVQEGGALFLDNAFAGHFDPAFFGAEAFSPLGVEPRELTFPDVSADLAPLQQVIRDASYLYNLYADRDALYALDYGVGARVTTATVLARCGDLALYTLNRVGEGFVLLTSPLLPHRYTPASFTLEKAREDQGSFNSSTASLSQLFRSSFATYVAREKYGFSLERVFGSYGRPAMSWELHYEEITGIENDSAIIFGDLAKESLQIPSYTLIRNAYWWYQRSESITYLLGREGEGPMSFTQDAYENAYSSGTHVVAGDQWLTLASLDNTISYFADDPAYRQTAYPCVYDLDGDGVPDILTGGSDGHLYLFSGTDNPDRFTVAQEETLSGPRITAIRITGTSTPVVCHIDQDSYPDILSGTDDGAVVWYSGTDSADYTPRGTLLNTGLGKCQIFPDVGDVNGDGALDLLVGTDDGRLMLFYGAKSPAGLSFTTANHVDLTAVAEGLGHWIAPRFADLDGDGDLDIAVGTFEGYIATIYNRSDGWAREGYLEGESLNYKGNYRLKFGNNCVPFFADVNGDGALDLVAGSLEYGMAYPIDSPWFPQRKALEKQVKYIQDNYYYLGVHAYTHEYADSRQENRELELHREAFASYGIDFDGLGANQHTWHVNRTDWTQTFLNQYSQGILWNSGFKAPGSDIQMGAENVLSMPFYVVEDGEPTMLIQNVPTLLYDAHGWSGLSARYNMPMNLYYHCDMIYKAEDPGYAVRTAGAFQDKYNYNFVREDQLFKGIHAAYNTHVSAYLLADEATEENPEPAPYGLALSAREISQEGGLYDKDFQAAVGVKLTLAQRYSDAKIQTDADVWYREGNDYYLALNKDIRVYTDAEADAPAHLVRVNLPAVVTRKKTGVTLEFTQDGMMQVLVSGPCTAKSEGWIVTEKDGGTQFTRYGEASTLELVFAIEEEEAVE